MKKKEILVLLLSGIIALGGISGCQKSPGQGNELPQLDPNNPTSIVVWHYYNGAQQAAFEELVGKFNATEGKEDGIYVESYSYGSVADLEQAISESVEGKIGSEALPNLFSTYADTAYAVKQKEKLLDLRAYFSEEELSEYVDDYIQEGYFGDDSALYLFPIAKSTEVMMLNKTDWQKFADATGATIEQLSTVEGITETAESYYKWTDAQTPDIPDDGKAFYGRDAMSNYFIIGMKQMGTDLFEVEDGSVTICADKEKMRRLWENYYVPYVKGYFESIGKFRSDDVKTGDIIAYTGASSSVTYFPNQVVLDDESKEIDYEILPIPVMEGGELINVQQGAGMAVTKSDEAHEYAATRFLRWFTQKENNLCFACEAGYLPVRKDANTMAAVNQAIEDAELEISEKNYDCLKSVFSTFDNTTFYTTKSFENGYTIRSVLDESLSEKAKADKQTIDKAVKNGASREEETERYITDDTFESWYNEVVQLLNEKGKHEQ